MSSNDESIHNSEQRQHTVYLMQYGDWSTVPDDWGHWRPKVFFVKDGAIGMDFAGKVIVKPIEAWAAQHEELEVLRASQHKQCSALQRCKAWLSAILRRSNDEQ